MVSLLDFGPIPSIILIDSRRVLGRGGIPFSNLHRSIIFVGQDSNPVIGVARDRIGILSHGNLGAYA